MNPRTTMPTSIYIRNNVPEGVPPGGKAKAQKPLRSGESRVPAAPVRWLAPADVAGARC